MAARTPQPNMSSTVPAENSSWRESEAYGMVTGEAVDGGRGGVDVCETVCTPAVLDSISGSVDDEGISVGNVLDKNSSSKVDSVLVTTSGAASEETASKEGGFDGTNSVACSVSEDNVLSSLDDVKAVEVTTVVVAVKGAEVMPVVDAVVVATEVHAVSVSLVVENADVDAPDSTVV